MPKYLSRLVVLCVIIAVGTSCALLRLQPADPEIQQTRKLAVQLFAALEQTGTALEAVQVYEIGLHDAGTVSDEAHRAFQTRLLVTARVVRAGLVQVQRATRLPDLRHTVQAILDAITDLRTEVGPKLPASVGPMLGTLVSALTVVLTMLGGA